MSGSRLFMDTNAVIALLKGDQGLANVAHGASWIGMFIISQIEFLCFSGLTDDDRQLFDAFSKRVEVIDLTSSDAKLIAKAIEIRRMFRMKLPDAIIAASAMVRQAMVVTRDAQFSTVTGLATLSF